MATATKKKTGFKAPCIKCGEEATVRLDLSDLDSFVCCSCDAEFTTADVRATLAEWQRVLSWIEAAPVAE
jgi:hypothetical protein